MGLTLLRNTALHDRYVHWACCRAETKFRARVLGRCRDLSDDLERMLADLIPANKMAVRAARDEFYRAECREVADRASDELGRLAGFDQDAEEFRRLLATGDVGYFEPRMEYPIPKPLGGWGYADLYTLQRWPTGLVGDVYGLSFKFREFATIYEIKPGPEAFSVGDTLRQLSFYGESMDRLVVVCPGLTRDQKADLARERVMCLDPLKDSYVGVNIRQQQEADSGNHSV
jgi:hypothetical protein